MFDHLSHSYFMFRDVWDVINNQTSSLFLPVSNKQFADNEVCSEQILQGRLVGTQAT